MFRKDYNLLIVRVVFFLISYLSSSPLISVPLPYPPPKEGAKSVKNWNNTL